jgi:hypothetical protein
MPPRRHCEPGRKFDPYQSDLLNWLRDSAEVQLALFDVLRGRGAILYDRETGLWRGKDWKP